MRTVAAASFLLLCLTGCARVPPSTGGQTPRLLRVTFSVRGQIQTVDSGQPYYYFVLLNRTDDPGTPGPAPVVERPWGNGFAAASTPSGQGFVAFVSYNYRATGYAVYSCLFGGTLVNPTTGFFTLLGQPFQSTPVSSGGNTISFQVNLNDLPNPTARYLQVNIVATNNTPQGAEDAPKLWDALGDGSQIGSLNQWVTIDTQQNVVRTNDDTRLEPTGASDVRDHIGPLVDEPNLDIDNWQIELRNG